MQYMHTIKQLPVLAETLNFSPWAEPRVCCVAQSRSPKRIRGKVCVVQQSGAFASKTPITDRCMPVRSCGFLNDRLADVQHMHRALVSIPPKQYLVTKNKMSKVRVMSGRCSLLVSFPISKAGFPHDSSNFCYRLVRSLSFLRFRSKWCTCMIHIRKPPFCTRA